MDTRGRLDARGKKLKMRLTAKCNICNKTKENIKGYRTRFGKEKEYSACEECQKNMNKTAALLAFNHKKAIDLGELQTNSCFRTVTLCE